MGVSFSLLSPEHAHQGPGAPLERILECFPNLWVP